MHSTIYQQVGLPGRLRSTDRDVRRAALSICPWMDGSRAPKVGAFRRCRSYCRGMRMAACPPKSVHFQEAVGHAIRLPFSWFLLLGKQKKLLAHLLGSSYEVRRELVCEIIFIILIINFGMMQSGNPNKIIKKTPSAKPNHPQSPIAQKFKF